MRRLRRYLYNRGYGLTVMALPRRIPHAGDVVADFIVACVVAHWPIISYAVPGFPRLRKKILVCESSFKSCDPRFARFRCCTPDNQRLVSHTLARPMPIAAVAGRPNLTGWRPS